MKGERVSVRASRRACDSSNKIGTWAGTTPDPHGKHHVEAGVQEMRRDEDQQDMMLQQLFRTETVPGEQIATRPTCVRRRGRELTGNRGGTQQVLFSYLEGSSVVISHLQYSAL